MNPNTISNVVSTPVAATKKHKPRKLKKGLTGKPDRKRKHHVSGEEVDDPNIACTMEGPAKSVGSKIVLRD